MITMSQSGSTNPDDWFVELNASLFVNGTRLALAPRTTQSKNSVGADSSGLNIAMEVVYGYNPTGEAIVPSLLINGDLDFACSVLFFHVCLCSSHHIFLCACM